MNGKTVNRVWQQWLSWMSRHDAATALLLAALVIVAGIGVGYESLKLIPPNAAASAHYLDEPTNPLRFLAQWDSSSYLRIAEHGYQPIETNFFPLYPLLIRLLQAVVGSPLVSALVVSWASFVGVVYVYFKILRELYPKISDSERVQAALLFVLFPTGIFFLAAYTESLFIFLSLSSVYWALRKRWLLAALFVACASLAHLNGLFFAVLGATILWESRQRLWKVGSVLAGGLFGVASYLSYLGLRFQNPLVLFAAQANHSAVHFDIIRIVGDLLTRNGVFFALLVLTTVYWAHKHRWSFVLYTLLYVGLIFVGSHGMSGLGRYTLAVLPVPLMLYDSLRRHPLGYSAVLALSAIGWSYFTILYVAGFTGG